MLEATHPRPRSHGDQEGHRSYDPHCGPRRRMATCEHGDGAQDEHAEHHVAARVATVAERVPAPLHGLCGSWTFDEVAQPCEPGARPCQAQQHCRISTPSPPNQDDNGDEHHGCGHVGEHRIDEVGELVDDSGGVLMHPACGSHLSGKRSVAAHGQRQRCRRDHQCSSRDAVEGQPPLGGSG